MALCPVCGGPIPAHKVIYCSLKCTNKARNRRAWKAKSGKIPKSNPPIRYGSKRAGLFKKLQAVMMLGGKCKKCGYDKNLAALVFHHINPLEKEFQLTQDTFSKYGIETLADEIKKCDLLCHNCHAEIHYPKMDMNLLTL